MKATIEELKAKIQEKKKAYEEARCDLKYLEETDDFFEARKCRVKMYTLSEEIENLENQLKEYASGTLPQEISAEGRRMFLGREESENAFAFFYQAADSFSPDIYVDAENMQKAGELMESELMSRGIEW